MIKYFQNSCINMHTVHHAKQTYTENKNLIETLW